MQMRVKEAFTLLEMMVVLALIGVIMAFALPRVTKYLRDTGKAEIKFKIERIKEALIDYRMTFDAYPTTREGLRALVTNPHPNVEAFKRNADKWPFVKEEEIADKTGNEFIYNCPPVKYKGTYRYLELIYLGPTQTEGDPDGYVDGI
ncbi:MAG: type II secretion system protein GspG [Candidatus Babeliales bacterium]|jgi:general secretion pathway protein G